MSKKKLGRPRVFLEPREGVFFQIDRALLRQARACARARAPVSTLTAIVEEAIRRLVQEEREEIEGTEPGGGS